MKTISLLNKSYFFSCCLCLFITTNTISAQCDRQSDSLQLVRLYDSLDGENWTNKWDLLRPINTWYGIKLDTATSTCVIEISLENNLLQGEFVDLNLIKLEELKLCCNQISGTLPDSFSTPSLKFFELHNNHITGQIPDFKNIPKLERLRLNNNRLDNTLPDFTNLPVLKTLYLQNNRLSGFLPNFSDLNELELLYIQYNLFSDTFPNFNLPGLGSLIANNNYFSGKIPDFKKCTFLGTLHLHNNYFTGEFPNLDSLTRLINLSLRNNQLTGNIPDLNKLNRLNQIWLGKNNLLGNLPNLNGLTNLELLEFRDNKLGGQIPMLAPGATLIMDYNQFTFSDFLPLQQFVNYKYAPQKSFYPDTAFNIEVGSNFEIDLKIDSSIINNVYRWEKDKQLWKIENTNKLIFTPIDTNDYGRYTVSVTNPIAPQLTLFSGIITLRVCDPRRDSVQLHKLYQETDGDNWLNKTNWLMSGIPISEWHGIDIDQNGCVQSIDLSGNNLTGSLPPLELISLDHLNLSNNALDGSIPELIIPFIKSINFRNNKLVGAFPNALKTWIDIEEIDFGVNKLKGPVPPDMGDLCLTKLKLDSNLIEDNLPESLTKLQNLQIGKVDFRNNLIDTLMDRFIFFCPFGDSIFYENNFKDRFVDICNKKCIGDELQKLNQFPWMLDTIMGLPCPEDSTCYGIHSEAGFVWVRGIKVFYTTSYCCKDTGCIELQRKESRFFDCSGKELETAKFNAEKNFSSNYGNITESIYDTLKFEVKWVCGDPFNFPTTTKNPKKSDVNKTRVSNIHCYPNPITAGMILQCAVNVNARIGNIRILDLSGRNHPLIWKMTDMLVEIELPELMQGLYVLEFSGSDAVSYEKILVH